MVMENMLIYCYSSISYNLDLKRIGYLLAIYMYYNYTMLKKRLAGLEYKA